MREMLSMKQQVIDCFNGHRDKPKSFIMSRMLKKGISRRTINRALKQIQDGSIHKPPKRGGHEKI